MGHQNRLVVSLLGVLVFIGAHVEAQADARSIHASPVASLVNRHHPRPPPDPTTLRAQVVKIDHVMLRRWSSLRGGAKLSLPWFNGARLAATVTRIERSARHLVIEAAVAAEAIGSVVLVIGADGVTGAIAIDTELYRLRSLRNNAYALVQVDPERFVADNDDALVSPPFRDPPDEIDLDALRDEVLRRDSTGIRDYLAQIDLSAGGLRATGARIDVLIAYSTEVTHWASGAGLDLQAEIITMVGETNGALAASGVFPRLRLVGTAEVTHKVVDPAEMKADAQDLRAGAGSLVALHDLRDSLGADLVSMLVMNGTQAECGVDTGRACGYAFVPREFAGLSDVPGTTAWEKQFASLGFSILHAPGGINGHTFKHEIAHNLGAHHDMLTFFQDGSDDTADFFAKGWILLGQPGRESRTIMAYDRLCKLAAVSCPILPVYSNPLQHYFLMRRGDPKPGFDPVIFGPADNKSAINNMAATVANYRPQLSP